MVADSAESEGALGLDAERVRFVLVQPQSGGNVGAAARALMNLGFSRLVLVRPECDPLGNEALKMAIEARELLERATVHDALDAALGDAQMVVGTSGREGKHRRPHWRLDALAPEMVRSAGGAELAVVFGREDSGLTDAELDRATHLIRLPGDARYSSFNLAQAVLLVAYELRKSVLPAASDGVVAAPATHREREGMYAHLERALLSVGFLSCDTTDVMMRRLRRMLGRAELTAEEVKILRGVARQALWAAGRAGLTIPPDPDDAGR
jgi:TrmH family RNA methyltransferase